MFESASQPTDPADADRVTAALSAAFDAGPARQYPSRDGRRARPYVTADHRPEPGRRTRRTRSPSASSARSAGPPPAPARPCTASPSAASAGTARQPSRTDHPGRRASGVSRVGAVTTEPARPSRPPWAAAWWQAVCVGCHPGGADLTVVDPDDANAIAWARTSLRRQKISDLFDALVAVVPLPTEVDAPAWAPTSPSRVPLRPGRHRAHLGTAPGAGPAGQPRGPSPPCRSGAATTCPATPDQREIRLMVGPPAPARPSSPPDSPSSTDDRVVAGPGDPNLTGRLAAEVPGIINWALDGLARLGIAGRDHGTVVQPRSGHHHAGHRLAHVRVRPRALRHRPEGRPAWRPAQGRSLG